MARLFQHTVGTQYASNDGGAIVAIPFTMSAWVKPALDDHTLTAICIGHKTSATNYAYVMMAGDVAGDYVRMVFSDGTAYTIQTTIPLVINTWHHIAMAMATGSQKVWVDGVATSDTRTSSPVPDIAVIGGRILGGTPAAWRWDGDICEVGLWNVMLSDADVTNLSTNLWAPSKIQTNLVGYWPVFGDNSPEPDDKNDYDMTISGSPAKSTHKEGIVYPDSGLSIPIAMRYYRARSAL